VLDRDEALGRGWPRTLSELEAGGYHVTPEVRCYECGHWVSRVIDPAGRVCVLTVHPKPQTQEPAFSEHRCFGVTRPEAVWNKPKTD
jgi:hypothetical protein